MHDSRSRAHVLVLGGSGFVGSSVVRELRAADRGVTVVVRAPERAQWLRELGVRLERGDMRVPDGWLGLVDRVDAVVHAAQLSGARRLGKRALRALRAANAISTAALADRCAKAGTRLLYTSGCFVYGDRGDEWIDERTPHRPSPLGVGHAREVAALRALHAERGLDVVVLTPGFVYGPGGLFKQAFYDQAVAGRLRVIGRGENWWSTIEVGDLGRAYLRALDRASPGDEFNVVDHEPIRLRGLTAKVATALGQRPPGPLPAPIAAALLGAPLIASLTSSFRIESTRARQQLGWEPRHTSLDEGLPGTLAAMHRQVGRPH